LGYPSTRAQAGKKSTYTYVSARERKPLYCERAKTIHAHEIRRISVSHTPFVGEHTKIIPDGTNTYAVMSYRKGNFEMYIRTETHLLEHIHTPVHTLKRAEASTLGHIGNG